MAKENNKKITIMMTGGGSGGHIFPLVAVARELKKISQNENTAFNFVFVGPLMNKGMFKEEGFTAKHLITGKLRRYMSLHIFLDAGKLFIGFFQAFYYILATRPKLVFSKGGYGSFPTVVMGRLLGIPVISHEADKVPGLANKILAAFSNKIVVSFPGEYPEFDASKIIHVGNPVRDMHNGKKENAIKKFSLDPKRPVVLAIGGSQGAAQINDLVLDILPELTKKYEIIHQTGRRNADIEKRSQEILPAENKGFYRSYDFLNEAMMQNAYIASDIIISRAGAGSIFEIALVGKPSILIPLKRDPSGHQKKNAEEYERSGACISLVSSEATPELLLENIRSLFNNQEKRERMSKAAKEFSRPDAAEKIAKLILDQI